MAQIDELVGKQITAIRNEAELTVERFAQLVGVSVELVKNFEAGISCPCPRQFSSIVGTLGVRVHEFVYTLDL